MAQHVPMNKIDNKKLQERAKKLKGSRVSKYSMMWQEIEPYRLDYVRGIKVSKSVVSGGVASMEVVTDDKYIVQEVYLVA